MREIALARNLLARRNVRITLTMLAAALLLVTGVGCGDDNPATQTGKGAPPGVTGEEAGGFTVEAGKQRDPKDIEQEKKHFSPEPPPIQILSGDNTGYRVDKPTVIIAKTAAEWKKMRATHFSRGVKRESLAPTDFKERQIVGLFMPKVKKGILVIITDVFEENGKINVKATRLLPGKGCRTAGFDPRPFHMVETRKMRGQPALKLVDQEASPC